MATKQQRGNKEKKINLRFTIDCSKPVEDKVFSTSAFADFLRARIKVQGKTGNFGTDVTVANGPKDVSVHAGNVHY